MSISDPAGPTISIVTPCYNSVPFLDRIHRSLQAQTYRNFEWVCADDCSTDDTVERLLKLEAPGELGMQVYRLPQNSYWSMAVAQAVRQARGEVILLLDHDDELLPDALALIGEHWPLVRDDPGACGLLFQVAFADGTLIGRRLLPRSRIHHARLNNLYPDVHDVTYALKAMDAKRVYGADHIEPICLNSVPMIEISQKKSFVVAPASHIRIYHRDNPKSQTISLSLSRKWVSTYARLLDITDFTALASPVRWVRHMVAAARFSKRVHGNYSEALRQVRRPWVRLLMWPAAWLAMVLEWRRRSEDFKLLDLPHFDSQRLDELEDLKAG